MTRRSFMKLSSGTVWSGFAQKGHVDEKPLLGRAALAAREGR